AGPCHRPAPVVPVRAGDHVVAVAQGSDAGAHAIAGEAAGGADEAVGFGDKAADPFRAAAPRRRPVETVPVRAGDPIVAVGQARDAAGAHVIVGVAADQAVGGGDRAGDPGRAAAPGRGPAAAVPIPAADHVVAVGQRRDAYAHPIAG